MIAGEKWPPILCCDTHAVSHGGPRARQAATGARTVCSACRRPAA